MSDEDGTGDRLRRLPDGGDVSAGAGLAGECASTRLSDDGCVVTDWYVCAGDPGWDGDGGADAHTVLHADANAKADAIQRNAHPGDAGNAVTTDTSAYGNDVSDLGADADRDGGDDGEGGDG